ncbi:OsmC family protein [soil metagenome]
MDRIDVRFPGGKKVTAQLGPFTVATDQSVSDGGDGTAPGPFELFLASLATCAGFYVLAFCDARGISTEGVSLCQRVELDPTSKLAKRIQIELTLPPSFPQKYREAVIRAAEGCKVKRTIAAGLEVVIVAAH